MNAFLIMWENEVKERSPDSLSIADVLSVYSRSKHLTSSSIAIITDDSIDTVKGALLRSQAVRLRDGVYIISICKLFRANVPRHFQLWLEENLEEEELDEWP